LATGIFLNTRSAQTGYEAKPLLAFDPSVINKITVSSSDDEVILLKRDSGWSLPELNDLPVNTGKLDTALSKLKGLQTTWPVTTTASSHERFEVSADKYQRRVRLYQDDKLTSEVFLGTSPGFRNVHVRPDDDNNVYALAIDTYEFPAREQDWLDKSLLAVQDVSVIEGPDYVLRKRDKQWQFEDSQQEEHGYEVNADRARQLSQTLRSLRVTGVADKAPEFAVDKTVTIAVSGTYDWLYQLLNEGSQYFVKRSDMEQVFTLSQHDYDRLTEVKMADLRVEKEQKSVEVNTGNAAEGG
jgi:hypothetical protein